jgi:hypothetical protein
MQINWKKRDEGEGRGKQRERERERERKTDRHSIEGRRIKT